MLSIGQARHLAPLLAGSTAPALIVRVDWTNWPRLGSGNIANSVPLQSLRHLAAIPAREALDAGASAITCFLFVGYDDALEAQNVEVCATYAAECRRLGLPLIIETIAMGPLVTGANVTEILSRAARMAVEIGADILKVPYTGDPITFKRLVQEAAVPVLVLGGAKSNQERDALELAQESLDAGASGVLMGRNVTQSPDPARAVEHLRALIHEGKSIDAILHGDRERPLRLAANAALCTGCRLCLLHCHVHFAGRFGLRFARLRIETDGLGENTPRVCDLCGRCVESCPTAALTFHPSRGYLQLDAFLCTGCRVCVKVCPDGLILFADNLPVFCDLCHGDAVCVQWCPTRALTVT
jgi:DhnA family fructose-bisphosphate aldolase class Ia/Fe-S-cluster-containing hydrogenase component 2